MKVQLGEKTYKLHMGMSSIADLQEKHGQDALEKLEPPVGAGKSWVPNMRIVTDVVLIALQRHHEDEADKYLVDDLIAANPNLFTDLMTAMNPEQKAAPSGNGKRPKAAA
ncbi:hypothetical protein [Pararhodobacter zhoushanensis]|uniref:Phage tail assembly chaperone protein, E, or 41 or 14 n=1 Tax=Pararhodobacter zhoushanensis TaxID=2479545 RepID=A0ABT3GYJ9_9RHOB|nr:hypothetical protein [Pararhodobacter zhoushanensis]MCW1932611.1 hypothetical protein [Pararhodobacter zhoushanensis]